ncbi:MAG: excinuclease ABC subunit C [Clostridia bacterium]|nr:excinuclease ABC subunit C [Clostridia bacterium]
MPDLLKKANELPESPGVYIMYDNTKKVIYVGKAKNLKNRVTSYFRNGEHTRKTEQLVAHAENFEVIVCPTELDALLTECSLIKRHNPFYNILLKNSYEGYPFICVYREKIGSKSEALVPRLKLELVKNSKAKCFGPFMSRIKAKAIVEALNTAFLLPKCNYKGTGKRVCLNKDIGQCCGFCAKDFPPEKADEIYNELISILNGNIEDISSEIREKMEACAENLDFESAASYRDRLRALEEIEKHQRPTVFQKRNADYIAYKDMGDICAIFMLRIRNGYIFGENCNIFKEPFTDDLLRAYIERFYTDDPVLPSKIYIENDYEWLPLINEWLGGIVTQPTFSSDKELIVSAEKNAAERLLQFEGKTMKAQRILAKFNDFIGMQNISRIEVYDISHIAGSDIVCGMITSVDGVFSKKDYKKFKIAPRPGGDDTAYMQEAVSRRLARFLDGDKGFAPLPDIIVCDGGRGQINAVCAAVESSGLNIPVIGFKKDSKHKTKAITFRDPNIPDKQLASDIDVFAFCGRLQEEVHRFAISYHKMLRDRFTQQTKLTETEGIGKTKARALFMHFKSIDKIRSATVEELCQVKGMTPKLAEKLLADLAQE